MASVRNIGGIGGTKPIPVIHFIPPKFSPVWKIECVTDTETIDLTELMVKGSYLDGVTSTIGDFEFQILDPNNTNSNKIEEFDTINIYVDYGTDATTLRFAGKIERKSNQDQIYLTLSGRSIAMITTGINITYSSSGPKARSTILKELIAIVNAKNSSSNQITITGIEDDLTEIDVNYEELPFWDIIEGICISGGRDAYIDKDLVFQYFIKGSRENTTEAVVEGINLIEAVDYAKDTQEVYTKVRVYGKKISDIPIIATSASNTTNTKGIVKELKIDNASVESRTQATELAEAEATDRRIPPTIGSVLSIMLPTLLPGEKVNIVNPINNIPPAAYQINSFRQTFPEDGSPQTELIIQKEKAELATILKSNIKFQSDITDNINKSDMDFSEIITFDVSSGTFDNTKTYNDLLVVDSGETGGLWTSDTYTLSSNLSKFTFMISGNNLASPYSAFTSHIFYSLNGGASFTQWADGIVEPSDSNSIVFRIALNQASADVEVVALLYTTE